MKWKDTKFLGSEESGTLMAGLDESPTTSFCSAESTSSPSHARDPVDEFGLRTSITDGMGVRRRSCEW